MSKTKKLTPSQLAALQKMETGKCDYYDLARVGANGSTIKTLCNNQLANIFYPGDGSKQWQITELGRKALKEGRYAV